jgi:SAM-dependent methyltransferase
MQTAPSWKEGSTSQDQASIPTSGLMVSYGRGLQQWCAAYRQPARRARRSGDRARRHGVVSRPHPAGGGVASLSITSKAICALLPWPDQRFDRVVSWFTSFGYFDDTDNRRVLREAHRVLRPAGSLLIENNNLVELLPRWQPAFVTERDGPFAIDRSRFDPV